MQPSRDPVRLVEIMRALRDPATGCPWDVEQTFDTIVPYTVEETFEVVDAIERRDAEDLREELGDLLLQVVYYAQMAEEIGLFDFGDVVEGVTTKMVRRHPHVFGDAQARNARSAKGQWERIKAEEKAERAERRRLRQAEAASDVRAVEWAGRGSGDEPPAWLDTVPGTFPALLQARKLQERAATVGFDWGEPEPIIAKIREELEEFEAAQGDRDAQEDELGDLLFSVVNLARRSEIEPEAALRRTSVKFRSRFGHVERRLIGDGRTLQDASLQEMEALWQEAKSAREPSRR